ncbi:GWxTD domain-containing protein [Acidobacteria bacterium AH-259-L09]|nr:GWxTD domain-containing protein [Acidobacteria bacterium AH-259-L09]
MKKLFVFLFIGLLFFLPSSGQEQEEKQSKRGKEVLKSEEEVDYYKKWLEQDVVYIITDEEKEVFLGLSTEEEKEQFIEQFWFRRDPDSRTAINDYKEEYYRRIAYVNEKFGSGIPGWKTDRGRTYITFGPPDIIEDHPSGGWYYRPHHEGGGATSTYPFQIWTYNYIEGIGDQIEVEFVDRSWSGEYRMALEPWEKDALLHVGFMGPTDAELEGSLSKLDRPYFSPGNYRNTRMQRKLGMRMRDKPFEKIIRFYQLQKPEPIKFKDLKQLVTTQVIFQQFPFRMGYEYLIIDADQVLVPITLEFENKDLTFTSLSDGAVQSGQLNIYGIIQKMTGRVVTEFEDTLRLEFPTAERDIRLQRKSLYQKMLLLSPGRYKLTLAVKDDRSEQIGTLEAGLILPSLKQTALDASSIILARLLQFVETVPDRVVPFVLGDFKVVPNVTRTFNKGDDIGLYLQIYNAGIDQSSLEPSLDVEYQILRGGKIVKSYLDPKKNSVLNYRDRLLLLQAFDLQDLLPGNYTLRVKVRDQIGNKELSRQVDFSVTS